MESTNEQYLNNKQPLYEIPNNIYKEFEKDLRKNNSNILFKNIDVEYFNCVKELILSDKYINHIDLIKLNYQLYLETKYEIKTTSNIISNITFIISSANFFLIIIFNCLSEIFTITNRIVGEGYLNPTEEVIDRLCQFVVRTFNFYRILFISLSGYVYNFILLVVALIIFSFLQKKYREIKYRKAKSIIRLIEIIQKDRLGKYEE